MRKSIRDAILAEAKAAQAINEKVIAEERDFTDVEKDTITEHLAKAKSLEERAKTEADFAGQFKSLTAGIGLEPDEERPAGINPQDTPERAAKRLKASSRFVQSEQYKALLSSTPNGRFAEKTRVNMSPVEIPGGMKDLFYSGDRNNSAGFLVEDDRRGLLAPFYERPLSVRALFASGSTNSDTIDYVRMTSVTNGAAVVPEARSADPVGGAVTSVLAGVKPQSTFEFERDSTTVKTIAHWIPITKRALSDAAQIQTMIDSFLRYGLEEAFEDELLTGSGTGEHFLGLYNTPGIQTQSAPGTGEDNFDVLKKARTKVQIGGRANPTGYVMNPLDWQDIELMRDANGNFYGSGPFSNTGSTLWGLPVITSEAVTPGTAWVADWGWGVIYDREQASVQATDSHADFFVRNLVAILAEFRAAMAILRPAAFVKVTLG